LTRSGQLHVLATFTQDRSALLSDLPSMRSPGLDFRKLSAPAVRRAGSKLLDHNTEARQRSLQHLDALYLSNLDTGLPRLALEPMLTISQGWASSSGNPRMLNDENDPISFSWRLT
jgi:hypothetical protein